MTEEYKGLWKCEWHAVYSPALALVSTSVGRSSDANPIPVPRTCDGLLNLYIEAWAPGFPRSTRKCQPEMWPPWGRMNYERCDESVEVCR